MKERLQDQKIGTDMCKYYLTATLLNAFTNGYDSLISMLKREPIEQTEAMQKGIEFEEKVMRGEVAELKELAEKSHYQVCLHKKLDDVMLFGYSDLLTSDRIYDLKYKKSYEIGCFYKSTQHLIYTYCADIDNFTYIIGVGDNIFYEDYTRDDKRLKKIVKDFFRWLEATDMEKYYYKNYSMKRIIDKIESDL